MSTTAAPRLRVRPRWRDERGSASLELAILAPALLVLLAALVLAGRFQVASSTLEHATRTAAREASLARTPDAARTAAQTALTRELRGSPCTGDASTIDTRTIAGPVGTPGTVTVAVSCTVTIADLAVPGLPGTRTLSATASSPVDAYRSRP
ncbi:TadE/TadG family type IV pilus assembly protein [Cellulomonas endophytica]|uniref:TadE/TadG family type IV pilus assembly protein n=1 Tax=Cellulomonas endophytica TaxID=2494735 RepID=UPI001F0B78DF|nr:TadE/TadG family type IV pilus assembly protein [Cellulomonas endophytica]